MTIICAASINGKIAIAADSLVAAGNECLPISATESDKKLFQFKDSILGFTGYTAIRHSICHLLANDPDQYDFSCQNSIFDTLLKIQPVLKEQYFLQPREQDSQPTESNHSHLLVINPQGIFVTCTFRSVHQLENYYAIGCGAQYALGAMEVLFSKNTPNYQANHIAKIGAEAAIKLNAKCQAPVHVKTIDSMKYST